MKKSNWTYVLYQTFNLDLLFWIVIDNLFLSTVKGFDAFHIVLITLLGLTLAILMYPLTTQIIKRTSNKTSIIIGSVCLILAVSLFIVSNSIIGFIIGQTFYNIASPFRMVSSIMLKNNLEETNKGNEYVKWQSYGKLGYSIITLIVSVITGFLFNINPYIPLIFSLIATIISLIFSIIYSDSNAKEQTEFVNYKSLCLNKVMIFIFLINIFAVGAYAFLQTKSTLLIQYTLEEASFSIAKISIIISALVFGSRICRVVSNLFFPKLYDKIQSKNNIFSVLSLLILVSNVFLAIGANVFNNYIFSTVSIVIGFYLILLVRDLYEVMENKIITLGIKKEEQKQAFVLMGFYERLGKLLTYLFATCILGFFSLNILYIFMLSFTIVQLFISFPLSKYLKGA